jgi:hypothetical protein
VCGETWFYSGSGAAVKIYKSAKAGRCVFTSNAAGTVGGAVYAFGSLEATDCHFSGNNACEWIPPVAKTGGDALKGRGADDHGDDGIPGLAGRI